MVYENKKVLITDDSSLGAKFAESFKKLGYDPYLICKENELSEKTMGFECNIVKDVP